MDGRERPTAVSIMALRGRGRRSGHMRVVGIGTGFHRRPEGVGSSRWVTVTDA